MSTRSTLFVLLTLAAAQAAVAHDKWEYVVYNASDDDSSTLNFLQHGARQVGHDLHDIGTGPFEEDWYAFKAAAGHSYEARVNSGNMYWGTACTPACPRFDLVTGANTILAAGQITADDVPIVINRSSSGPQNAGRGMTVRWTASATEIGFLRARTDAFAVLGPDMPYDISFRDTTYFAPRWNNSGTQVSVFILQNTTAQTVGGTVAFHNAAGTLLASAVVSVPPDGVQVISTASLTALVGQSGSATIAQSGGYGALAGKVVSLEPSTGFTFDTALAPLPY
jgi:hypothetical protein